MVASNKNFRRTFRLLTSSILILQLVIGLTYSPSVYAANPLPDRDALNNQINSDVQQGLAEKPAQVTQSSPTPADSDNGAQTDVVNSGDDASVDNSSTDSTNTTVNNNNDAEVNQNVNATANTGYNQANGNISFGGNAGVISTGNAGVNVSGTANVNNNSTGISGGSKNGGSGTSVVNSGNNLSTSTSNNGNTTTVVNNNNTATINQGANTSANTGGNEASGNIAIGGGVAGVILTGDAWTDISFMTVANGSATLVGGTGNGSGPGNGADIYITNTGGRFSGINRLYQRANTVVNNANNATVNQSCGGKQGGCEAITGGNSSNNNIAYGADAGVIHTGDAIVDVELDASVNSNNTAIQNGGNGGVDANANVVNTGDDLDLTNSADSETNTVVNNNNRARINQNVNAVADTGHNTANYNISFGGNAGVITTGNAIVNVVMNADANNNTTQVSEPSAGMGGTSGSGANTQVLNTGDNATITNTATTNNNTIVNNNNSLDLDQNVNAYANTGDNTASGNMSLGCSCTGRFACISPCTAAGGIAGGIYTGDAFIQTFMSVVANHNETVIGDPAVALPNTNNNDPAAVNGAAASTTAQPTTAVPTTHIINAGTGGTAVIAGTASEKTTQGVVKKIGKVLGAAKLPSTGAEDTLLILIAAAALMGTGVSLKKLHISNVSPRKEVKL